MRFSVNIKCFVLLNFKRVSVDTSVAMHNMIVQPPAVRVSVLLIVILFLIGQNKCDSHGEGSEGYSPSHESEVVQVSQNQV